MKTTLGDNFVIAEKRLRSLTQRFKKDPALYLQYKEVLQDYLNSNIIEPVQTREQENEIRDEPIYYLPHSPVIKRERTTTKIRIVFDGSSHETGKPSLNDCLLAGPNLYPDLYGLLIRFRENRIAFVADMEKAFLQILLDERDRDATRFLWTDATLSSKQRPRLQVFRFTRILFGMNCSPFILASTVKLHLKKYVEQYPEACELLSESLYVDDVIGGTNEEDNAYQLSQNVNLIMRDAGFNMRKWHSNSSTLNEKWGSENQTDDFSKNYEGGILQKLKILGMAWNSEKDYLYFDMSEVLSFLKKQLDTKRFILQTAGRIFDPLGLISPYTIRIKIIFQELWVSGVKWDSPLPETVQHKWSNWCQELGELTGVSIPRHYYGGLQRSKLTSVQLHTFCDASNKAYGAVTYARTETTDGKIITCLVSSKTRVAPLKKITLPRLELMGALIAARLNRKNASSLKMENKSYFWTDSIIALYWIRTRSNKFKPFVQNRIQEIQSLTEPSSWSHCPGKENPADCLSRGLHVAEMLKSELWLYGPGWLKLGEEKWPQGPEVRADPDERLEEIRPKYRDDLTMLCAIAEKKESALNVSKYRSFWKLVRIVGWILRFKFNSTHVSARREGCLAAEEMVDSERILIKVSQADSYTTEILQLKENRELSESPIATLNPFLDEQELLRVKGRLQEAEISFEEKHPIILSAKSKITELLIQDAHKRTMHGGTTETLAHIRRRFWIPKARQVIKKIIRACLTCRKFHAKPASEVTAPLPKERINQNPAFQTTGVDFFGPLFTKNENDKEKSYVALFTCAVTRAVHLELVSNLTTEKFLMALKRFFARRGVCKLIMSDNAKTFEQANKEIQKIRQIVKDENIQDFLGKNAICWKNIVPRASWWGGFWERLVRSVKTALKKVLGRACLTFEEMTTLLSEIEAVLNSRPLTYTFNENTEPEPLTPAHFLVDGNLMLNPPNIHEEFNTTREELTRRKKYRQLLLRTLWKRWKSTYLLELRSAHHYNKHNPQHRLFLKDDVVLIEEDKKQKMLWKMGVVKEVFRGRDGKVRSCAVRTPNGNVIKRPIQLLYPLEITDTRTT